MKKLNKRKIRWIVREIKKKEQTIKTIAAIQNITPQWAKQIYTKYKDKNLYKKENIVFEKPGRKPKPTTKEEIGLIMKIREKSPYGAISIEKLLNQKDIKISHNRIHRILLEKGLANKEPKKSVRRKWVRYEREHANSLWHTDWCEYKGDKIIVYEDDASRFITGFGVFDNATATNSVKVLQQAVKEFDIPEQLMTDHGTQFTSLSRESCKEPQPNEFQKYLKDNEIEHIKARIKHPQSNGKIERLFRTLKILKDYNGSWKEAVKVYNYERIHMSLELEDRLRTPYQAFLEKQIEPKELEVKV